MPKTVDIWFFPNAVSYNVEFVKKSLLFLHLRIDKCHFITVATKKYVILLAVSEILHSSQLIVNLLMHIHGNL